MENFELDEYAIELLVLRFALPFRFGQGLDRDVYSWS